MQALMSCLWLSKVAPWLYTSALCMEATAASLEVSTIFCKNFAILIPGRLLLTAGFEPMQPMI